MALEIKAAIRGLGHRYADDVERIEIHVSSNHAKGLPYTLGVRVPVFLNIQGESYDAGLRSTTNNTYVWICPDLRKNGKRLKLAHVIAAAGFKKNDQVLLLVNGKEIFLKSTGER